MENIREKYPWFKTRDFDTVIPKFSSHKEARSWFKEKFGRDFIEGGYDESIDGEKVYFYVLVVHRKDWEDYQKYMSLTRQQRVLQITDENEDIVERGMFSNHKIDIWEDGRVHVVY